MRLTAPLISPMHTSPRVFVVHVRSLHGAEPDLRDELFAVAAALTGAFPALYGAAGSYVFLNNVEPDGQPFHLHVHAVPRFGGDG
jgi:diadenosine tetraphosphate (Ap4A) HIT family hydrolase